MINKIPETVSIQQRVYLLKLLDTLTALNLLKLSVITLITDPVAAWIATDEPAPQFAQSHSVMELSLWDNFAFTPIYSREFKIDFSKR